MLNINGILIINKILICWKKKLINVPILKYPSFNERFIIRMDASYEGIEGVLLQEDLETTKDHPIRYIK